jgi:diaminopimelate decarboxylase
MHDCSESKMKPFHPVEGFLTINTQNHLSIDDIDTVGLVAKYGTPIYVLSEKRVRANYRKWFNAFESRYRSTEIFYALKANPLLAVCKILQQEGASFEVGGPGELQIAQFLGASSDKIIINGSNKSRKDLAKAIEIGAVINVDSIAELNAIQEEAVALRAVAKIAFRVNPDVRPDDPSVHLELWTGLRESKFGIDIESGLAYEAYRAATKMQNVKVVGIHTHIGSPVEDARPYRTATERVMEFAGRLKRELGIDLESVNLGGGFAIPFQYKEGLPSVEEYVDAIATVLQEKIRKFGLKEPRLIVEPGGAVVGDTAILLLKVGMTKKVPRMVKWVMVDGGANIILRASQGWYKYQLVRANSVLEDAVETVNIAGPLCYSGDVLARDRSLPRLTEGDILAALDVGAYTFAYEFHGGGSHPFPAIILVAEGGRDEVIRRPESLSAITSRDMIPERMLRGQ